MCLSVGNTQFLYIRTDVIIKTFKIVTTSKLLVISYAIIMKEYYLSTKRQNCAWMSYCSQREMTSMLK